MLTQDQSDVYTRRMEIEKRKLEELDKTTKMLNIKVLFVFLLGVPQTSFDTIGIFLPV